MDGCIALAPGTHIQCVAAAWHLNTNTAVGGHCIFQRDTIIQTAGAFRFMQMGTGSRTHLVGYEATLDFWTRLGLDKVAAWDRRLADRLRAGIASNDRFRLHSPHHPEMAGAMVTWEIDGVEGPALQAALWDQARIRVRHVGKNRVRPCVSC